MTELNTIHDLIHTPIYSNLYIHACMHVIYLYFISDDTPGETSRNPSIKNICVEDKINNDEYYTVKMMISKKSKKVYKYNLKIFNYV